VNYFSATASAYLPTHMNEMMLREKSFATARLPMVGTKTVVGMPRINNVDYLVVASADGYLFCYTIEPSGGECTLMRQYRIGPTSGSEVSGGTVSVGTTAATPASAVNTSAAGGVPTVQNLYPQLAQKEDHSPPSSSGIPVPASRSGSNLSSSPAGVAPSPPRTTGGSSSSSKKKGVTPPPVPQPPSSAAVAAAKSATTKRQQQKKRKPSSDESDSSSSSESASGKKKGGEGGAGSDSEFAPPADLDDLDEYPPLSHAI
jgi:hypothetical protein